LTNINLIIKLEVGGWVVMSMCGHFHFNESCSSQKVLEGLEGLRKLSKKTIIQKQKGEGSNKLNLALFLLEILSRPDYTLCWQN